jgi:hypothetical protein
MASSRCCDSDTLARALGWISLGIGAAELTMPGTIARWMGIEGPRSTGTLRAMGAREIGHGIDLLSHDDPAPGVHARLAGDGLDGVLMASAAARTRRPAGFAAVAAAVMGVVALDVWTAIRLRQRTAL